MQTSYVYFLTNKNHTVLYTGVTSNLQKRIQEHKNGVYKGFTSRYNCNKVVWFQEFTDIKQAIEFEKRLKAGNRKRKERLINDTNPEWKDLFEGCF